MTLIGGGGGGGGNAVSHCPGLLLCMECNARVSLLLQLVDKGVAECTKPCMHHHGYLSGPCNYITCNANHRLYNYIHTTIMVHYNDNY